MDITGSLARGGKKSCRFCGMGRVIESRAGTGKEPAGSVRQRERVYRLSTSQMNAPACAIASCPSGTWAANSCHP